MTEFYFDEIIKVLKIDDQVVYDKVSRVQGKSQDNDLYLELEVNKELYPMLPGEKFRMVISNTLLMDGSAVTGYFPEGKQKSLADKFEYVMHGLLYKMSEIKKNTGGSSDSEIKKNTGGSDSEIKKNTGGSDSEIKKDTGGSDSEIKKNTDASDSEIKKNTDGSDSEIIKNTDGSDSEIKKNTGESSEPKLWVYISFGGLQLMLRGDPLKMYKFKVDQRLFLLLRKA